jgi:hypothetical protein
MALVEWVGFIAADVVGALFALGVLMLFGVYYLLRAAP